MALICPCEVLGESRPQAYWKLTSVEVVERSQTITKQQEGRDSLGLRVRRQEIETDKRVRLQLTGWATQADRIKSDNGSGQGRPVMVGRVIYLDDPEAVE